MTYPMQEDEMDEQQVVRVPAEEITSGDTFPSHDGDYHDVEGVSQNGNVVSINVRKRRSGEAYSVEFPADYVAEVLA